MDSDCGWFLMEATQIRLDKRMLKRPPREFDPDVLSRVVRNGLNNWQAS